MATAVFRQDGASIDHTPGAAVAAGDVVVQGDLIGVAKLDIEAGRPGALAVEGVFDFPKATGAATAITSGTSLFWDEAAQQATSDDNAGANKALGKSIADASDDDTTVRVRINQ